MPRGTNPFDDDYYYSDEDQQQDVVGSSPVGSPDRKYRAGGSTNPFDHDDDDNNAFEHTAADQPAEDHSLEDDADRDDADIPVEASWQFLRDLPYRRVPIYSNICWNRREEEMEEEEMEGDSVNHGLAAFPPSFLHSQHRSNLLDARDVRELLNTTTVTKVAGCPHGGPIAAITLPILAGDGRAAAMTTTELRIMTNAGRPLATIEFPPRGLGQQTRRVYSAADVLTIGFTNRMVLIVVLRDSLCFTFDLSGTMLLPPFYILPSSGGAGSNTAAGASNNKSGTELLQASVYEGGVAVLSTSMQSAIVELFDDHDDPTYADSAHLASRKIVPTNGGAAASADEMFGGSGQTDSLPPHYAIVTPLPTATHASENYYSYVALAVLPRFHTTSRHPEVFLSTSDNSVVVVNTVTMEIIDVDCRARISSPIVDMTFAPNGRFLACFTQASILTVISTSFETKVLDFDTSDGSSAPPLEMKWCGEDSVVLHWKNLGVLMVGPYGDWLRFPYEDVDHLYIIPEIDCCRVVTDNAVELLQRVPPATALLMRIGSIEPSAMLLDASDAFSAGSPASDEAARAITKTGMLLEAIETCTEAATREFDIVTQKRLLRAASYGMHFAYKDPGEQRHVMGGSATDDSEHRDANTMPSPTTIKFVAAARELRIMNALRHPAVGFVLTASQYETITPTGVVARLIAMKRPALATSISKYLSLPKSVQLFARASKAAALVSTDNKHHSDAETADAAIKIINEDSAGASGSRDANVRGGYATVALAANKAGRPGVANLLLMLETSVADKVPALVSIGSYADAVAVATTARDADFIFYALMEFEKTCMASSGDLGQTNFFGTVVSKFTYEAFNTLREYLSTMSDVNKVKTLLLRAQKFADAGIAVARRAVDRDAEKRDKQLMLIEAARVFGLGKETAFHKSCTDDYLELLSDQEILRTKYSNRDFLPESSSVTSTIISVIRYAAVNQRESNRLLSDADKLARKFRVPEKRLWHVKVRALADSGQWDHLKALADSKAKPPIGYKPFALAAIKGHQDVSYILRFIDRVSQTEERYDLFCEANLWNLALEEAAKLKDVRRIGHVRSVCNSADIQQRCDKMLESFIG